MSNFPPMVSPRFRILGALLQYKPFPSYPSWLTAWDVTETIADAIAAANTIALYELPFAFNSAYPLILLSVPALATITSVRLHIETPFDVPTSITVGDADTPDRLMTATNNNPLEIGEYETAPDFEYPDITTLVLLIDAPGATAGAGRILIQYDKE